MILNNRNIQLKCALSDWEMDQMATLMGFVQHWKLEMQREDRRKQILGNDGIFLVRSSYGTLVNKEEGNFNWKGIWSLKAPSKVLFFSWTALKTRIPTLDFLQRRGLILPSMCPLCKREAQSADYILFSCPLCEVWDAIFGSQCLMGQPE